MLNPSDEMNLDVLVQRFERFATLECKGSSPLYERLCTRIARDQDLLRLAAYARKGQPVPNLLLAAVHFLLLKGAKHSLASFYPSLNSQPTEGDPYPAFREFCLENRAAIIELISNRLVQTNEVQRSACLLPAFDLAAQGRPLSLIEIGSSAGLNLLWDRYEYDYGDGKRYGISGSPVQISCELRGELRPLLSVALPAVDSRIGVDLNPIDVTNLEAVLWLRALVWPEHRKRAELLINALNLVRQDPPSLLAGNALDLLPGLLKKSEPETQPCVFHSFTVNQFSIPDRERLADIFRGFGAKRDLAVVSIEWSSEHRTPRIFLTFYRRGEKTEKLLAYCDGHANWIEWLYNAQS
jgi:hypothetical protein